MKIVVAITGASGVIYGIRLLEELRKTENEIILVISKPGEQLINYETTYSVEEVKKLAHKIYQENDFNSPIVSGSYQFDGMVICPCSMKTISAIANGYSSNVISRAAECCLKENRSIIIVFRETPLNLIHISNLLKLRKAGAIVLPAAPGFYHKPTKIEDLINFVIGKILDQLKIKNNLFKRWEGPSK
jgi:4-hydroxy-3-polyprenylbenzoate decarboxylase